MCVAAVLEYVAEPPLGGRVAPCQIRVREIASNHTQRDEQRAARRLRQPAARFGVLARARATGERLAGHQADEAMGEIFQIEPE